MMKNYIALILVSLFIFGCSPKVSFYNVEESVLLKEKIIIALKSQKITAKCLYVINGSGNYLNPNSIYSLSVDKWKGVKSEYNVVYIPMIKIGDDIYINSFYINGELRKEVSFEDANCEINDALTSFKNKYPLIERNELSKIESFYREGIQVLPIGRLF